MSSSLKWVRNVGWKERLFGIKCPHCGLRGQMGRSNSYIRGYNNLCTQASGDEGFYCMGCSGITYLTSYEEFRRVLPAWCDAYPDRPTAKWFPDFKHNKDISRIPDHASHRYGVTQLA